MIQQASGTCLQHSPASNKSMQREKLVRLLTDNVEVPPHTTFRSALNAAVRRQRQTVEYFRFHKGGRTVRGMGNGSPPVGSRGDGPIGGLGRSPSEAGAFQEKYNRKF
jgi:hypothetical protein